MNKIKYIYSAFAILMALGLSSCLKEDAKVGPGSLGYVSNIVELADVGALTSESNSSFPRWTIAFDPEDEVTLDVKVSYSGANKAPEDIVVKLVNDPSIITAFNEENDTEYEIVPDAWFDIPNDGVVTIKKGEKYAILPVKVKLGEFSLTTDYGLPLKIESSSFGTVSGNFGAGMYAVSPKSILDGTFENTFNASAGEGTNTQTFSTVSPLIVTSGWLGIYSNVMTVYLDPENPNQVIRVTVASLGGSSIAEGNLDPATNYYDPATETLHLNYDLLPSVHWAEQTLKKKN